MNDNDDWHGEMIIAKDNGNYDNFGNANENEDEIEIENEIGSNDYGVVL